MIGYTQTPDFYNDYISHRSIIGLGFDLYDNYKKSTDKNYAKKKEEQKKKRNESVKKFVSDNAKKAHKYVYKYLNKKGKVIYVYDTKGKAHLRRMNNNVAVNK